MTSMYDVLSAWARRTTTSFAELWVQSERSDSEAPAPGERIYRLKHWPSLPSALRTADIYRTLSVMSSRRVNRRWILASSRMKPEQVDQLLQRLVQQGAVEVIDTSSFGDSEPQSRPDSRPESRPASLPQTPGDSNP